MAHFRHSQTLRHVYDCSRPASVSFVLQRVSIYVAAIPSCRGQAKNTFSSDGQECKCELDKIMRTATPDEFETTPDTQTAFDNQDGIGWQALLEGAPAKGWSDAQQRYYDALGKRNTGERLAHGDYTKTMGRCVGPMDHRNNVLHKKDDGVLQQQLQHDIREQVALGSSTVTTQARPLLCQ